MSCPYCDHTMQKLDIIAVRTWWCGNCGALKLVNGDHVEYELPGMLRRLVQGCKVGVKTTSAVIVEITREDGAYATINQLLPLIEIKVESCNQSQ